jgi:hypothetical protein
LNKQGERREAQDPFTPIYCCFTRASTPLTSRRQKHSSTNSVEEVSRAVPRTWLRRGGRKRFVAPDGGEIVAISKPAARRYPDQGAGEGVKVARASRPWRLRLTEREVAVLLADFATVWNELFPAKQARIVQLLVERVDVQEHALEVRIRAEGLVSLVGELRQGDERKAA